MKWSGCDYGFGTPDTAEERKQRTVRSLELQIIDRERELSRLRAALAEARS